MAWSSVCPKCHRALVNTTHDLRCPECGVELPDNVSMNLHRLPYSAEASEGQTPEVATARSGSLVVNRYRDAYRVGAALVTLGNSVKIAGAVLAAVVALASLNLGSFAIAGFVVAAIGGGLFWVCGVVVAAHGQTLRATLDTAVASSRFLTDVERANAMGLPPSVADRAGSMP